MNTEGANFNRGTGKSLSFFGVLIGFLLILMLKLDSISAYAKWGLLLMGLALIIVCGKKLFNN